ncbi:MAG: hypothetical protein MJ175_09365 [Clostridia bacterium]|nr:hypothetical protein [Clostridia bacterium]
MQAKEKVKKPVTKKKIILWAILGVFLFLLLWIVISVVYQVVVNGDYYASRPGKYEYHIFYRTVEPEEFDIDIFDDPFYRERNRDIKYISGAQSTEIALDEDASIYGEAIPFFQKYFTAVIHGDCETYRDFFWNSYFDEENKDINYPYPEDPFTMQKVYNISVEYLRGEDVILSKTETRSYFIVKYKIQDNNGTFRPELDVDTAVPLLFELTTKGEEIRISKIVPFAD